MNILAQLDIGIKETNAGIGIQASRILVWYRTKRMLDCSSLIRYPPDLFRHHFLSFRCRADRMPGSPTFLYICICTWTLTQTCSIDMNMQHGHGIQYGHWHVVWTWTHTCSTDLVMQHGSGQWTCMDAGMLIKSSVWQHQFSVSLYRLVRHRHSGIMVNLVPLVTDQSVNAQRCILACFLQNQEYYPLRRLFI